MMEDNWHRIDNTEAFDTPLMAVYPERIRENIQLAVDLVAGDVSRLRPHIKTHKTAEIIKMFIDKGIDKIKCATIAETELAAQHGIADVMLAYQPAGFKIDRFIALIYKYPEVQFSCLTDSIDSAQKIAEKALLAAVVISVYIDLNTGMNRTGYPFEDALPEFYQQINALPGLHLLGMHIYDGHLHDADLGKRLAPAETALKKVLTAADQIELSGLRRPLIIAGGSNTFIFYAGIPQVECSPGTFVFWDMNYSARLPELEFKPAAVLITTVISKPAPDTLCLDLGYKSVSSENPLNLRVIFVWNPDLIPLGHSEEHLTVKHGAGQNYEIGDKIYGIPYHICPSVALYDELSVVTAGKISGKWMVPARRRELCL